MLPKKSSQCKAGQAEEVLTRLKRLEASMRSMDRRLQMLEKKKSIASGAQSITESGERTLAAMKELAGNSDKWISIDSLTKGTGRSAPTETGYIRYLYRKGLVERRIKHAGYGKSRKRIWEYRCKK